MTASLEHSAVLLVLVPLLSYAIYSILSVKFWRSQFPPGPPGWPIIGNVFDMPKGGAEWVEYRKMSEKFKSDIVYLDVLGTPIIILNSLEAITDLLDKRSAIYSDRPRFVMLRELMGWEMFAAMPYGNYWRAHRRLFHTQFVAQGTSSHHMPQIRGVKELLHRLLESPDRWQEHLRYQAGTTILEVAYGIQTLPENDPYINMSETVMALVAEAAVPGRYLVDTLPWLKYVPAWFPGASFKSKAQKSRKIMKASSSEPLAAVKKALVDGTVRPSFAATCLEDMDLNGDIAGQELLIENAAGTMFGGGADTTVSALSSFFLAMLKYPEVQAKAHRELDTVLGPGHLPCFGGEASLPYLTAIVKECLRWELVLPLAVPHRSIEDDEYRGYHIPAGTMIVANTWAVMNDEGTYPDPARFNPDRFLTKDGKLDPSVQDPEAAFGYGRRMCPGRFMARGSIWLTVGSILASFDIEKAADEHGNLIDPSVEYVSSLLRQPEAFPCSIKPRSQESEKNIRNFVA